MTNFLMGEVSGLTGVPHPIPYPETSIVNDFGAKVFNNINVTNSTVGVINTGSIQAVELAITNLKNQGQDGAADALRVLTQAVLDSSDLPQAKKTEALQILSAVSSETIAPLVQRKPAIIRPLIAEFSSIIGGITTLATLADKYLPQILAFFTG